MRTGKMLPALGVIMLIGGCKAGTNEPSDTPTTVPFRSKSELPSKDVTVRLVPIGLMPKAECDRLAKDLAARIPLRFEVLPAQVLSSSGWEPSRKQFAADLLCRNLIQKLPKYDGDAKSLVIAITTVDLYSRSEEWRYVFAQNVGNYVVISVARMNPVAYGLPPNDELVNGRVRKMMLRRIGQQVYNMDPSTDPHSVVYSQVGGLDDLDRMSEGFLSSDNPKRALPADLPGAYVHVFSAKEQEQGRERMRQIDREIARQKAHSAAGGTHDR